MIDDAIKQKRAARDAYLTAGRRTRLAWNLL